MDEEKDPKGTQKGTKLFSKDPFFQVTEKMNSEKLMTTVRNRLAYMQWVKVTPNNMESSRCLTLYIWKHENGGEIRVLDAPGSETPSAIQTALTPYISDKKREEVNRKFEKYKDDYINKTVKAMGGLSAGEPDVIKRIEQEAPKIAQKKYNLK